MLGSHSNHVRASAAAMSNSAKLVLSWCQGVGGRSEFVAACQGVSDSLYMWSTMMTRQSTYHLPPIWLAPRPSPECATPPCKCRACVRGLEASARLLRRAKVQVGPWTCGERCQHVGVATIYLQYTQNHGPAPSVQLCGVGSRYSRTAGGCGYCRVGCGGNLRG